MLFHRIYPPRKIARKPLLFPYPIPSTGLFVTEQRKHEFPMIHRSEERAKDAEPPCSVSFSKLNNHVTPPLLE
jgi:hypothetical protein